MSEENYKVDRLVSKIHDLDRGKMQSFVNIVRQGSTPNYPFFSPPSENKTKEWLLNMEESERDTVEKMVNTAQQQG